MGLPSKVFLIADRQPNYHLILNIHVEDSVAIVMKVYDDLVSSNEAGQPNGKEIGYRRGILGITLSTWTNTY